MIEALVAGFLLALYCVGVAFIAYDELAYSIQRFGWRRGLKRRLNRDILWGLLFFVWPVLLLLSPILSRIYKWIHYEKLPLREGATRMEGHTKGWYHKNINCKTHGVRKI